MSAAIGINIQARPGEISATVSEYAGFTTLRLITGKVEMSIFAEREDTEKLKMIADIFNDVFVKPAKEETPAAEVGDDIPF